MGKVLIVIPSVPMVQDGLDHFLDIKAVEGLSRYSEAWPGPVVCLMRSGSRNEIAYGKTYSPKSLPFSIEPIKGGLQHHSALLNSAAVILASGDNHLDLDIANVTSSRIVFVIEYTLSTRFRIIRLDHGLSLKSLRSFLWTVKTERKRRKAFSQAAGLQANGTPAFDAYRVLTKRALLYFDNRMSQAQQATPQQISEKSEYIARGQPLRLAFSGRLERMKGADHLVPVIVALAAKGLRFSFDIYGDGSLAGDMKSALFSAGLSDIVRFHGPVSFDGVLVPALKEQIDLFVCCHRQADPSCTYIETLACGVPIVGYDNAAFEGVQALGPVGVSVPMDNTELLVNAINELDRNRTKLAFMAVAAVEVAKHHSFERTFSTRIDHLKAVAGL